MIEQGRSRALAVITALLSDEEPLARNLIKEDPDPQDLAWNALAIAAGIWQHQAHIRGIEASELWATALLSLSQRS